MLRRIFGSLIVSAACALALAETTFAQGWHSDDRYGFKIKPPDGWTQVPIQVGDQWLVGKYLCDREYEWYDKDSGWAWLHRPEMLVIAFVDAVVEDGAAEVEVLGGGERIGVSIETDPYEDYEDYLDRTYSGGGFYIADRKETKIGGVEVTQLEINVEKLTSSGPKYVMAHVYHCEGYDLAVQFEVLQDQWSKLKRDVTNTFRSFKTIPRIEGGLPGEASAPRWISVIEMTTGTPAERREARIESEVQHRRRAKEGLPAGWTASQVGSSYVLNHVDDRFAEKVVAQAEAVLAWLDATFPFVGPEEYVRDPIIRICESSDEEWAFRKSGDGWYGTGIEMVTHKDRDGYNDWEFQWLNTQLLRHWFTERDRELYWAMPPWLSLGLSAFIEDSKLDGRSLAFKQDQWDRSRLRELVREEKVLRPRELMQLGTSDFQSGSTTWDRRQEASALVEFLVSGKAAKGRRTKDVLVDYVRNLRAVIDEIDAEEGDGEDAAEDEPRTEEEEEAAYRRRQQAWTEKEARIIEATWRRTFQGWSERDWDQFAKAYFDSID